METKNGNVFYLIIDCGDKGEKTLCFLNQMDEADLMEYTSGNVPVAGPLPMRSSSGRSRT